MRWLKNRNLRRIGLLAFLLPALALGPIGCGPELAAIAPAVEVIIVGGTLIGAAHDLQEMEAARLERERLREWQIQNGGMNTYPPRWPHNATAGYCPPAFPGGVIPVTYAR
jgi:hypothetical protein